MFRSKNAFWRVIAARAVFWGLCILTHKITVGASMPSRISTLTPAQRAILFRALNYNGNLGKVPASGLSRSAAVPTSYYSSSRWQRLVAPRSTGSIPGSAPDLAKNTPPDISQLPIQKMSAAERQKLRETGIRAEQERQEKIERSNLPDWLASAIYRPTQEEIDWKVLRTPAEEAQQKREALQQVRRAGWQASQAEQEDRIAAAQARARDEEGEHEYSAIMQRIKAQEARNITAGEQERQRQAGIQAAEERRIAIEQSRLPRWAAGAIYRPTQEELDWRITRTDEQAQKERRESDWRASARAREERIRMAQERKKKEEALVERGLATQRSKVELARRAAADERENQRLAAEKAASLRQQNIKQSRLPGWAASRIYGPSQAEIDWMVTQED